MIEPAHPHPLSSGATMGLDLGPAPYPQAAPQWQQRIERGVQQMITDDEVAGLWDQAQVRVSPGGTDLHESDGTDLHELRLDLTGLVVTEQHRTLGPESLGSAEPPDLSDIVASRIDRVQILAEPVHVEGVSITAQILLESLPVTFGRDQRGHLWLRLDADEVLAQMRGNGTFSVPMQDVVQRARGVVGQELAQAGLTLVDLDLQMQTPAPRRLLVMASARVRKGLLSASARIYLEMEVDGQMVARIGQVHARSGNPLVALVLTVVRGRLEKYTGTTVDLNAHMPPGLRLQDVRLHADEAITAEARFA